MPEWICCLCNSRFEEPAVKHYREDMNGEGAWLDFWENRCPCCGAEEQMIRELEEMDNGTEEHDKSGQGPAVCGVG